MAHSQTVVLVVEDETLIRMDIADELASRGYAVLEAANADEALLLLMQRPEIATLFTDVDMPGTMDGLKLAAAVRDRWPPIQIIVTSGHQSPDSLDLPGGSMFFRKPYSAEQIAAAIGTITSQ